MKSKSTALASMRNIALKSSSFVSSAQPCSWLIKSSSQLRVFWMPLSYEIFHAFFQFLGLCYIAIVTCGSICFAFCKPLNACLYFSTWGKIPKIIDHFPIVFWIILKIHFSQNKLFPCPIHDVNPTFIKSFPLNRMINSIKVNYTPLLCVTGTSLPVTSLQFSSLPSQLLKHWLTPSFSVLHSSQRHKSEWTTSNLRFCLNHIAFSLLPLKVVWMFYCLFPIFILPQSLELFSFLMFQIPLTSVSFWRGDTLNSPNPNYMMYMKICSSGRKKTWYCIIHLVENL